MSPWIQLHLKPFPWTSELHELVNSLRWPSLYCVFAIQSPRMLANAPPCQGCWENAASPNVFKCPAEKGPQAGSPTLYSRAASSMGRTRWPRCSWLSLQMRQMGSPWSSQKSNWTCFMCRSHCGRGLGPRLAICRPSCHSRPPELFPGREAWHLGQLVECLPEALGSLEGMEQLQESCTHEPPAGPPSWA